MWRTVNHDQQHISRRDAAKSATPTATSHLVLWQNSEIFVQSRNSPRILAFAIQMRQTEIRCAFSRSITPSGAIPYLYVIAGGLKFGLGRSFRHRWTILLTVSVTSMRTLPKCLLRVLSAILSARSRATVRHLTLPIFHVLRTQEPCAFLANDSERYNVLFRTMAPMLIGIRWLNAWASLRGAN